MDTPASPTTDELYYELRALVASVVDTNVSFVDGAANLPLLKDFLNNHPDSSSGGKKRTYKKRTPKPKA